MNPWHLFVDRCDVISINDPTGMDVIESTTFKFEDMQCKFIEGGATNNENIGATQSKIDAVLYCIPADINERDIVIFESKRWEVIDASNIYNKQRLMELKLRKMPDLETTT